MAGKSRRRGGKSIFSKLTCAAFVFVIAVAAVFYFGGPALSGAAFPAALSAAPEPVASGGESAGFSAPGTALEAYAVDVGQGDSLFLRSPSGKTLLIDAGERDAYPALRAFLERQGVTRLDALVATHPHSDHIGGMAQIVAEYEIGKVYMPDCAHTSGTYEDLLAAIQAKGLKITFLRGGRESVLDWSDEVELRVLAPLSEAYGQLNNYSVVLRAQYRDTAILLTGDAENASEKEMLEAKMPLRADVLKLGHHGSAGASSKAFLQAVRPSFAIASAGLENPYNHPSQAVIDRLAQLGIPLYCTAWTGTVRALLDGTTVVVE